MPRGIIDSQQIIAIHSDTFNAVAMGTRHNTITSIVLLAWSGDSIAIVTTGGREWEREGEREWGESERERERLGKREVRERERRKRGGRK